MRKRIIHLLTKENLFDKDKRSYYILCMHVYGYASSLDIFPTRGNVYVYNDRILSISLLVVSEEEDLSWDHNGSKIAWRGEREREQERKRKREIDL